MQSTFFITQGITYEIQKNGGYIWSPSKIKASAVQRFYYDNITHFEIGDIVFHYLNKNFVAISQVEPILKGKAYIKATIPEELSAEQWYSEGYIAKCHYVEFKNPIPIALFHSTIMKYKASKFSAFNKNGTVCQGYLYHFEKEIADAVIKKAVENQPELYRVDFIFNYLTGD